MDKSWAKEPAKMKARLGADDFGSRRKKRAEELDHIILPGLQPRVGAVVKKGSLLLRKPPREKNGTDGLNEIDDPAKARHRPILAFLF